jgi:hypothetical protein
MGPSRRGPLVVLAALAAAAGALVACDALIGLNTFRVCTTDCPDTGTDAGEDVIEEPDSGAPFDGTTDAGDGAPDAGGDAFDAGDASDASDSSFSTQPDSATEAGPDVAAPTVTEIWVHWPMPNPDAAIAPGLDASLPNQMHYAPGDAGDPVLDEVTHLTWEPVATSATSYRDAEDHCLTLAHATGTAWRVPTRIELVSLIDFTRVPAIDLDVFGFPDDAGVAASGVYWTSSLAVPDSSPTSPTSDHWVVLFGDGTVLTGSARWIRCVVGGG